MSYFYAAALRLLFVTSNTRTESGTAKNETLTDL